MAQLIPLNKLIFDEAIYPRHAINHNHVNTLTEAIEARGSWPDAFGAIVVERSTNRAVDGWHRSHGAIKALGLEAKVPVEFRKYASDLQLKMEAVELNSAHGLQLDEADKRRMAVEFSTAGVSDDHIAVIFRTTEAKVQRLRVAVAYGPPLAETSRIATGPRGAVIPLKGSAIPHWIGRNMTKKQVEAHRMMPGASAELTIRQVTEMLRNEMLDRSNKRQMDAVSALATAVGRYLARGVKRAS